MAWRSFGLKQTSGGCGQNMKSHLSELQTKQTVFRILKNILEYFLATQLCSTEPEKDSWTVTQVSIKMDCYSVREVQVLHWRVAKGALLCKQ